MPCQVLLLVGVGGLKQFKEIIEIKISLRWDLSDDWVFTLQRQWASFPRNMQGNGVFAKGDTFSHFIEWTIDQFCGAWVLYKHPVFSFLWLQSGRGSAGCDELKQDVKALKHSKLTPARQVCAGLFSFDSKGLEISLESCLSDACSSLAKFLCYLEENSQCLEHISPRCSWVSEGSRDYREAHHWCWPCMLVTLLRWWSFFFVSFCCFKFFLTVFLIAGKSWLVLIDTRASSLIILWKYESGRKMFLKSES